ncbi:MAG: glucose-6-phosphate isomerase family protein [Candidatus Aenigmatarchaeota archaeon]
MKIEGIKTEGYYKIRIEFKEEPVYWERKMSELIKDKVIIDIENGGKALNFFGDRTVYTVYNLWSGIKKYKLIKEKTKLNFDLTLLKNGVFSLEKDGELFLTYGHAHEKRRGEFYQVIKNDCIILLANLEKREAFFAELKEGDTIFIHPNYIHRLISTGKDCLVLGIVPEDAGHNYEIVKNRGFPFHFFKQENWIKIVENKKFEKFSIKKVRQKKIRVGIKKLKNILFEPNKQKKFYKLDFF